MKKALVVVKDKMQSGYRYELTEPAGRSFHVEFKPELSPGEMLELGIFGGKYMTDCRNEFPGSWFIRAKLCSERHEDDERQIRKWKAIKRHIAQIQNNCVRGELSCRRKQRQAVLHWAYDSRKI
jgi:hypothetical protein